VLQVILTNEQLAAGHPSIEWPEILMYRGSGYGEKTPLPEVSGHKFLGYWAGPSVRNTTLPDPRDYIDVGWDPTEKRLVLQHLADGFSHAQWLGYSGCRICGLSRCGTSCQTDGIYVWPSGFQHYVGAHNVRPPQEFVDHIKSLDPAIRAEMILSRANRECIWTVYQGTTDPETCPNRGKTCHPEGISKCVIHHPGGGSSHSYQCQRGEKAYRDSSEEEEARHIKALDDLRARNLIP